MYTTTYDLLRNWNTKKEFTAVKLMVALGILQGSSLPSLSPSFREKLGGPSTPKGPG